MKQVEAEVPEPAAVVGDGSAMVETPVGTDAAGGVVTRTVPYRELVYRRAQAGQGSCLSGYVSVLPDVPQALFDYAPADGGEPDGAVRIWAADGVARSAVWSAERGEDGSWILYLWRSEEGGSWYLPAGWHGEAQVNPALPWLKVAR